MKKKVALLLSLIALCGIFAACNKSEPKIPNTDPPQSQPNDPSKITLGDDNVQDTLMVLKSASGLLTAEAEETPTAFAENVNLFSIRYQSGPCEVTGYAAMPKNSSEPLPCIIYNRGGNRDFGLLRPEEVCRFAEKGFLVFGSQYRGNAGGTGQEEFGGADTDDVISLIDIALSLPICQEGGVYMVGHSRGGMMTYLACARDSRIKAAAVGAGLSDCFIMYETREDSMKQVFHELVGGGPEEKREEFIARSATYWAEDILCPILICQGTKDWRVVPEQSYKMHEKLEEAGKPCSLIIYEGADHSLMGTTFTADIIKWFDEHPLEEEVH